MSGVDHSELDTAAAENRPIRETENLRVLLVADTHLGFDLPFRPRVKRRRRGQDFFANLGRALQPALDHQVDVVVHGGDLLFRSRVPAALVDMALEPLFKVAQAGVPVFLAPGNHERSQIPRHLWTAHENLYIFDAPVTFVATIARNTPGGASPLRVALSGFPFARRVRDLFPQLLAASGYQTARADVKLLCLHQTVEGATVGANDFTFRRGVDVIRGQDIPSDVCAVLAGHIHRAQTLTHDLQQRPLGSPVIYPGSIERTSFAERHEPKGYAILEIDPAATTAGQLRQMRFVPLPTRPMLDLAVTLRSWPLERQMADLKRRLAALDPDAVVRLRLEGPGADDLMRHLTAARLRQLAPPTLNVSLAGYRGMPWGRDRG
jgi:DNA repair exonuclease SbcCD nuclease subunit